MSTLGQNSASLRAKVVKNSGLKSVGDAGAQVCNLSVVLPRADVGKVEKDADGNPVPIYIDISAWGALGESAATFKKGDTVEISGEARMEEWDNKKAPERGDGKPVSDSKVTVVLDDDSHLIQLADDNEDAVNQVDISGDIVWASVAEEKTWDKDGETKSAHVRRIFVAHPVEKKDGGIARPTVHVEVFGHKCEDLEVGQRITLSGEIQNDKYQSKESEVNRYRGTIFVGVQGELKVEAAAAAAE